jgi:glucan phosphoethanolaminetransferase (alkaline phosphatase superfamily)
MDDKAFINQPYFHQTGQEKQPLEAIKRCPGLAVQLLRCAIFLSSLKSFLPSPSRYSLHNSLNYFSFWAVKGWKIHSAKDLLPEKFYKEYSVVPFTSKAKEPQLILMIMRESTSSTHMSLFSGREATTPNLDRIKNDANFIALPAISSGVCTHASLPLFFNLVREPGNIWLLESEKVNLFRLAKAAGYETHFISAQNALLTHANGTGYIDDLRTMEDEAIGFGLKKDFYFLQILKIIMQKGNHKKFIVLNFKSGGKRTDSKTAADSLASEG